MNNKVKLKVGRNILELNENDLILDNGSCYQIVTKKVGMGFSEYSPVMSKKLFNDLKKLCFIYTNNELKILAKKHWTHNDMITYWKFDINKMKKFGY